VQNGLLVVDIFIFLQKSEEMWSIFGQKDHFGTYP